MPELRDRLQAALGSAYQLEHELGGGGMSRVFRCTDTRLGRPVVVKVLPPDLGASVNIARFEREVAVVARLQHPHIVPLLTAGAHDDLLYYIMPYIDGLSLRARLAEERVLPIADTLRILREVVDALAHAHSHGIVHRDIKPGNVLLSGKHAFVTDFGVAKAVEESTGKATLVTMGVALGTPAYMAPEQATGDPHTDHRADIYALGALGYEMLTGRPPFVGATPQALLTAHLTSQPDPLTNHRPDVPPALDAIVMRCLAKQPGDRWQSATEVLDQLDQLATPPTGGITPVSPSPEGRGGQGVRTRRIAVLLAGVVAIGVAGFFGWRAFGAGPAGPQTLLASGVLAERDRLVLAEFENRTTDSTLGLSVSEALRIDLSQSPAVRLLDGDAIAAALQRMDRPVTTRIDLATARDLARREGAKAVVRGQIDPLGVGYVLAAELVAATDGAVLVSVRENARDDGELIDAVDRLSKRLREQVGESLRTIQASDSLERVTTGSLEALRLYSQALQADLNGEWDRAVTLLEQAIALDTGFAMAHRKLSAVLFNTFGSQPRINAAATSAYRHRGRLTPLERHLATASYYSRVEFDRVATEEAYRAALAVDPDNFIAANNLALLYNETRRFAAAESLALRHRASPRFPMQMNIVGAQLGQGKLDEAAAVARAYEQQAPQHPASATLSAHVAENRDAFDSAEARIRALRPEQLDLPSRAWTTSHLFALVLVRGKLRAAEAEARRFMQVSEQRRLPSSYLTGALWIGLMQVRFQGDARTGRRTVDAALARHPLDSLAPEDRPYPLLLLFLAEAGEVERARRLQAEYEIAVPSGVRRANGFRHAGLGAVAFAEGRWDDALHAYRALFDESSCTRCGLYELARIYDQMGNRDSALAIAERAVTTPGLYRVLDDAWTLAGGYRWLGDLYAQRGDTAKARAYYGKFVDLWKDADPVLQPVVRDVRTRLTHSSAERP